MFASTVWGTSPPQRLQRGEGPLCCCSAAALVQTWGLGRQCPVAAITNHRKVGHLKQRRLSLIVLEARSPKSRCWPCDVLSKICGGESASCLAGITGNPWLMDESLQPPPLSSRGLLLVAASASTLLWDAGRGVFKAHLTPVMMSSSPHPQRSFFPHKVIFQGSGKDMDLGDPTQPGALGRQEGAEYIGPRTKNRFLFLFV